MTQDNRPLFKPSQAAKIQAKIEKDTKPVYLEYYDNPAKFRDRERAEIEAERRIEAAADMDEAEFEEKKAEVEKGFWHKVRKVARNIPFLEDIVAAYYAMMDGDVSLRTRAALALGLLYFLWVIDLIPDFLGPLGFVDDGTVIATIIAAIGGEITPTHRAQARKALGHEDLVEGEG